MNEGRTTTISDLIEGLEIWTGVAQRANAPDTLTRCRELSLAITKLEEAVHWLKAIRDDS